MTLQLERHAAILGLLVLAAACSLSAPHVSEYAVPVVGGAGGAPERSGTSGGGIGGAAATAGNAPTAGSEAASGSAGEPATAGAPALSGGAGGQSGDAGAAGQGQGGLPGATGGGYMVVGNWHGYWVTYVQGVGSTIMPSTFSSWQAGEPICASGLVAATVDVGGFALAGFSINQNMAGPHGSAVLNGSGIRVTLVNRAPATPLLLELKGANLQQDPKQHWCKALPADGADIPYTELTQCVDANTPYAREEVTEITISVPGDNQQDRPFDFCVYGLSEDP